MGLYSPSCVGSARKSDVVTVQAEHHSKYSGTAEIWTKMTRWEMRMANCPHCNQASFEIEEVEVAGAQFNFVQCSGCKAPFGVIEHTSRSDFENRITEVLQVLVSSLQRINYRLDGIEEMTRR